MNSSIRWHGGKRYLSERITSMMPWHSHYAEVFFGGGSVLFRCNPEGVSETVNDVNKHLINFWKVLQDKTMFEQFNRLCQATPFSDVEFQDAQKWLKNHDSTPEYSLSVKNAWLFFVVNRMGRQGLGKSYATPSRRTRRAMNENVACWLAAIDGLPKVHERLKRVEIRCMDFGKFITTYDHKDCFFYLDPPYLHETRVVKNAYQYEMSEKDHVRLLDLLTSLQGNFILSGYHSKLYEQYAQQNNWETTVIPIDNKASSAKKKETKYEVLYYNY